MVTLLLLACAPGGGLEVKEGDPASDTGDGDSATDSGVPDSDRGTDTADTGEPADTGDSGDPGQPCDDADTGEVDGPDDDGDGFTDTTHGGDDCDDERAHVYPGAPDACDGLDQDCDGEPIPPGACSEAARPEGSAWVSIVGDPDHRWMVAAAPASPASAGGDAWFTWYSRGTARQTSGLAGGAGVRDLAAPSIDEWQGWWDELSGYGWPAGDVDGDGSNDLWHHWEPSIYVPSAVLLTLGPLPDRLCGSTYLWDLADAEVQVTDYETYDGMTLIDSGVDLDGDGLADAVVSLSRWEGMGAFYLVGGPALLDSFGGEIADTFPHVELYDDGSGGTTKPLSTGSLQLLPDVDGDGLGELIFEYDCGEARGIALLAGGEFSAGAAATAVLDDLVSPACGDTPTSSWALPEPYRLLPTDRATDADGDGHPDAILGHVAGDGSWPDSTLALVDLHDPAGKSLDDLVLRRLSSFEDRPWSTAGELMGAYLGAESIDDRWLAVHYDGTCLYRLSDLPLGGTADRESLPAPCMDDRDARLEDIEDLDGDGLPEWIWSESDYEVDGVDVGRVSVVLGFDVPYDDPTRW